MRQLTIAFLLAAMGMTAYAADLSGDWSGEIRLSGEGRNMPAFFRLQQKDSTVTGQAGPSAKQLFPIKRASFNDNKVRIETSANSPVQLLFELTLRDSNLTGRVFEDGVLVGPVELKRAE